MHAKARVLLTPLPQPYLRLTSPCSFQPISRDETEQKRRSASFFPLNERLRCMTALGDGPEHGEPSVMSRWGGVEGLLVNLGEESGTGVEVEDAIRELLAMAYLTIYAI